jgi:protocatechuate 3,4-dioxygenase beta subunit
VLALLDQARRTTLIAVQKSGGYVFDIYLQGDAETVFFDV